jgi:CHAD domain-containing protein
MASEGSKLYWSCYNDLMSIILLTDEQKNELILLTETAPQLLVNRAMLILAYAEGKPTMQAASEAGISRGRARYWKRQFLALGMEIFGQEQPSDAEHDQPVALTIAQQKKQYPKVKAELPRQDGGLQLGIPYPKPKSSIGIEPEDTLAIAGRKVWLYHFAIMVSHEQGTLLGEDEEELHDMRVATRRMRSAYEIFGPAFHAKVIKRYLQGLRKVGKVLGTVRDMDVILANGMSYGKGLEEIKVSGFEPLLAEWRHQIEKRRIKLTRHLQSEAYQNFKYNFNLFLQQPDDTHTSIVSEEGMNSRLRDSVPILIYSRFAAVRAYESVLPSASIDQLHALRIDFKKFRYTLEFFREILGDNVGQIISELKQLQDHLGELHDAVVACDLIKGFLINWDKHQADLPISERLNPEPIVDYLAYLYSERYRLTSTFPRMWKKFNRPEFRQNIAQAIAML